MIVKGTQSNREKALELALENYECAPEDMIDIASDFLHFLEFGKAPEQPLIGEVIAVSSSLNG